MQRDKISDIKVNIDIANVIKSATFGMPLIAEATNNYIPYTVCNGIGDVLKAMTKSDDIDSVAVSTYDDNDTVDRNETFVMSESASGVTVTSLAKTSFVMKTVAVEDYTMAITGVKKNEGYISLKSTTDSICKVVLKAKTTASLMRIAESNAVNVIKTQTVSGLSEIIFKCSANVEYFISSADNEVEIYAIEFYGYDDKLYKACEMMLMQKNAPEYFAVSNVTDGGIDTLLTNDFRACILINAFSDDDIAKNLATAFELDKEKLLFIEVEDTSDDVAFYEDFERTVLCAYADNKENLLACALVGATASKVVGSFDYKAQTLKNVKEVNVPLEVSKADYDIAQEKNIILYVQKAGVGVTDSGNVANGTPIDLIDTQDWLILQIQYQLQQVLNNNDKIPYDNSGIAILESAVINVLEQAYKNGMIAVNEEGTGGSYTVDFARRSETKAEDRLARRYVEAKFSFDLAGSIRKVVVNGVINI